MSRVQIEVQCENCSETITAEPLVDENGNVRKVSLAACLQQAKWTFNPPLCPMCTQKGTQ